MRGNPTHFVLFSACLAAVATISLAQDSTPPPATPPTEVVKEIRQSPKRLTDYKLPGFEKEVNLQTFTAWDVNQVVEFLVQKGGLNNVVISKGVAGAALMTKLRFDKVTVGDALEIILSVNNLAYEIKGGILKIMTDDEYKALYGVSFYDNKKVRIVNLKYADANRVATMLASLKSSIGLTVADPVTGTLILVDTPTKIEEMMAVVTQADTSTTTETMTFNLQYAKVEDILPEVEAIRTKEVGSVRADKRTKTLIVTDMPHKMDKIASLISMFDRKPKQVFIESKITETTLSDDFSMGINWEHMFQGLDPRFSLSSVSKPGAPTTPVGSLTYKTIVANGDLTVVLDALKAVGKTEVLANPHIAVLDGQEASIEVVEDQPYKEVTLESGTTNVTGVTYLFKKVGVLLHVTPRINDDGFIGVSVKPEISTISQWYDGPPQEGTPVIRKAVAETSVLVKDGVTIIIGGMIRDRKDRGSWRFPVLGSIPLLGKLFRYDTVSVVNTETVVFLTPRIVSGEEPFLRMRDMKKEPKPLRTIGSGSTANGGSKAPGEKTLKPVR